MRPRSAASKSSPDLVQDEEVRVLGGQNYISPPTFRAAICPRTQRRSFDGAPDALIGREAKRVRGNARGKIARRVEDLVDELAISARQEFRIRSGRLSGVESICRLSSPRPS